MILNIFILLAHTKCTIAQCTIVCTSYEKVEWFLP